MDIEKRTKFAVQLAGKKFELPIIESLSDDRFDNLVDYIDQLTHSHTKEELTEGRIKKLLSRKIETYLSQSAPEFSEFLSSVTSLTMTLHEKVLNHENTIWSFVLKNNFRPIVFNNTIDIVVGNPPWLTFKDVKSTEYKKELEDLGLKRHKIAPVSSSLRTQMELATIFLTHAVDSYLKKKGLLYFVLPRSLFSAEHHSNFREQTYTLDMKIDEIRDLFDITPLFRVPSCVVVASHNKKAVTTKYNGRVFKAKFPEQNMSYAYALPFISESRKPLYLVRMGKRSALSAKNISVNLGDEYYQSRFKDGATIYPRSYFFVDTVDKAQSKKIINIETSKTTKINAKKPYNQVDLKGRANTQFIFNSLIAENILPFTVVNPFVIHLPFIQQKSNQWEYISPKKMLSESYSDSSKWFSDVEESFSSLSKTGMSIEETLNYHGKLLSQNPKEKIWVLYCAAGTNVCASVYKNTGRLWVDHTLYWFCPKSGSQEAYYLAGVLNSSSLNELIKPFQSKGLLGERHVHKKILDVGILRFNESNKTMIQISEKAELLSKNVEKHLSKFSAKAVGKRRSQVRELFKKEFDEIDKLVTSLFTKSK